MRALHSERKARQRLSLEALGVGGEIQPVWARDHHLLLSQADQARLPIIGAGGSLFGGDGLSPNYMLDFSPLDGGEPLG